MRSHCRLILIVATLAQIRGRVWVFHLGFALRTPPPIPSRFGRRRWGLFMPDVDDGGIISMGRGRHTYSAGCIEHLIPTMLNSIPNVLLISRVRTHTTHDSYHKSS